ncbi:DivIVA domain-containing protein [Gordonia phthalatica]|uniref:Cell division protein DivIVA n=1 Tax=Gordonia phthalatica TaxID=1136941 RepID=A0A0N9N9N7_9ACTN|nr:DivIVA domain-containing protein [Gordonia phthalatica]ALG84136.1 cell division protein DivIVA [Gordonia phthalatica]
MVTIGLYVIGVALMVALLFALVWFVFGRGEELPPIEKGTTLTRLPRAGIEGDDVRRVVFQQTFRGYKASEVDWTLEKLAREIDELRAVVHDLRARDELASGVAIRSADPESTPSDRPDL